MNRLLIGYDFALGKGREGTATRLSEIGREMGYKVEVVEAVSDESGVISSSAIRKLISVGKVAEAAEMLGHFYALSGPVIHGDARGKRIGIPTANIESPPEKAVPAFGIYACRAIVGGRFHPAAVSIGIRPTFEQDKPEPRTEAYLLDFDSDIYGQTVKLEFVKRLRDELKFPDVESLTAQIESDIQAVRNLIK